MALGLLDELEGIVALKELEEGGGIIGAEEVLVLLEIGVEFATRDLEDKLDG